MATIIPILKKHLVYLLIILAAGTGWSQNSEFIQFSGKVTDQKTKKALVFATLSLDGTNVSTITNTEGEYLLKVPASSENGSITVSFLGYTNENIPLSSLERENGKIALNVSITELSGVNISAPKDARGLLEEALKKRGENYFSQQTVMTAFYRETIKKRKKNVSLSEAVVNIHKAPYGSIRKDKIELYKARKSTDYTKLDTLALKLQGGPFNTLFVDLVKYPDYVFSEGSLDYYEFSFKGSTQINNRLIYIIDFNQKPEISDPFYQGTLYIDAEKKILTSAVYALNITDKNRAAALFVRKKPRDVKVWPTDVAYRVDYREKDGRWYYGYSNVVLEFRVKWDNKLFSSPYRMNAEMAITDWRPNTSGEIPKAKDRLKQSIILSDEAIGFSDPQFWGEYNIIEPEKSIESAIRKIQRQLKRTARQGNSIP